MKKNGGKLAFLVDQLTWPLYVSCNVMEKPTLVLRGRVVGENPGHEVGKSPVGNEEDVHCKPAVFGACLFKLPILSRCIFSYS